MREVPRGPANAAPNIENSAVPRKHYPLSLIAGSHQPTRMEMFDSRKDFRGEVLRIVSQFS